MDVRVVIVSLCTLLNVDGKAPNLPARTVLIPKAPGHTAFIAWKDADVTPSIAGTPVPARGGAVSGYSYYELQGVSATIEEDPTYGSPQLALGSLARSADEWEPQHKANWQADFVSTPKASKVSAIVSLGMGNWTAQRPTTVTPAAGGTSMPVEWQWIQPKAGSYTTRKQFAREVWYTFTTAGANPSITFDLSPLTGSGAPATKLTLTLKSAAPLEVFLGNDVLAYGIHDAVNRQDLPCLMPGYHLTHLQAASNAPLATGHTPGSDWAYAIPPAEYLCPSATGGGGGATGYCGPDGQP